MTVNYCLPLDLYSQVAGLTSDNTKVTTAFLNDLIDRQSRIIDAHINARYVVPVPATSPKASAILKNICIGLCIPIVKARLILRGGDGQGQVNYENDPGHRQANKLLEMLQNKRLNLIDAEVLTDTESPLVEYYDIDDIRGVDF